MRAAALALVLLSACSRNEPPVEIPPAEPRPANIGSIKWMPESPRWQQMREQAFREGRDFSKHVDFSRERTSRKGLYRASLREGEALQGFHTLILKLTTADGAPVHGASFGISGGMPEHGHGLPTQPKAVATGTPGEYRIEGVQFGMPGWWELSFYVASGKHDDTVTFNLKNG